MADITMPQLGETVTEGTITKWMKAVGDEVKEDEVLFEVSTDKVDSEVPSPASGYLAEILVPEGETVDVGAKLAVISSEPVSGNGGGAPAAADKAEAPAEEAAEAAAEEEPAEEPEPKAEEQKDDTVEDGETADESASDDAAEPEPEPEPKAKQAAPQPSAGTRPADDRPPSKPAGGGAGGGKVLSPVVRKLLAEHDLDPDTITGTGAGGRITRADVLAVIDKGQQGGAARPPSSAPAAEPAAAAPSRPAEPAVRAGERDETIPFSNIRKRTAEHMVRSIATAAHTLVSIEVDFAAVDAVRKAEKDRFKAEEGVSLTYLPFIARAIIDAIREYPHVNASVGNDELVVHHYVNLGIAVDLNLEGLIVPVVHDADNKRLRALAREMADLAQRARSKKLGADDIAGGTITITNPGPFGTLLTYPVINQPQVAILSTDGVKMRPVAVEQDDGSYAIAVHPVGNLALSFDHRAYDGAYAAAFLHEVGQILETRDWSQEL
ncbi:MAG: 2-oxo acid dehydrogenase subunit E2 [Actinobacteria bacterium]|nr:2-oxo acid dehydrogenase subunit E2 [Actinomycetota bacterium]MBV8959728.1 2-oxo acid dehydrogenase subunit E2 [Actinomycetota bacterium]MBV9664623.1 2-oxo acid dehydrogenase subunit E2 [Actinomycetota bacterium]MBV9934042.1 2-oxo acid dehydrogenase subunit E2 [Actinomycetota bacterium]